jgi:mRNA interferase MazF
VGPRNGLDKDSVVSVDNVVTIPVTALGHQIGFLLPDQESDLAEAIRNAFDLE